MAEKKSSKDDKRKARKRKTEKRSKPKSKSKSKSKSKPKSRPKTRSHGSGRRTAKSGRRLLGLGRRASTKAVHELSRRDRMRAKRRRARNHLLATAALTVTTFLVVESFSAMYLVLWAASLAACVVVFRPPRDSRN